MKKKIVKRVTLFVAAIVALSWLSGCVTASSPNAAYGTCAQRMDVRYCGEGN